MERIYLNEDWFFTEEFKDEILAKDYDAEAMTKVRLPHTCKELPFNYFDEKDYQMVSGYRHVLFAPEEWAGKSVLFTCEGAGHETVLYVNGQAVLKHSCGYTAFTVDLASYLRFGEANIIVLKVDSREELNVPPFGFVIDYMTFGGVYREVYLEIKEPVHIADAFIKPDMVEGKETEGFFALDITLSQQMLAEVHSPDAKKSVWKMRASLQRSITDVCPAFEEDKWQEEKVLFEKEIIAQENQHFKVSQSVSNICRWDLEHPYLYNLHLELLKDGEITDEKTIRFGFRRIAFKKDGFYLNEKKIKIRGLNRHQSYPYIGYAAPESLQKDDAQILKYELGVNAVRTSHYPQSHYFIDRCDELGLLVFTEFPGWQHIGNGDWKAQACINARDMVMQYRNHASIIIWGVRINESQDDDAFYEETNRIAHELDDTRPTGGVRNFKKSHLFEDVYTYNDFVHDGKKPGCEPKSAITSDMEKGYLITENNGHMYPTKAFDWEEKRLEHALRHARVINAVAKEEDIAGSFAWCMFDYNTHKDFGSGDRICYHGVTDMFRNQKLAAATYASQQDRDIVLEVSSSMDIGEHPATNLGPVYIFTNADSVRMYKNDNFIKEYTKANSEFSYLPHGPILVDDLVGDMMEKLEGYPPAQAKLITDAMNYIAVHGYTSLPPYIIWKAVRLVVQYHLNMNDLVALYTKYVGNWGETATVYRFEAIKDGKVVKTVIKQPMFKPSLEIKTSHTALAEKSSYDMAAIRIRAIDENGNVLPFYQEALTVKTEGPIELVGAPVITLKGGMGGFYVRTKGVAGMAKLSLSNPQLGDYTIDFTVEIRE